MEKEKAHAKILSSQSDSNMNHTAHSSWGEFFLGLVIGAVLLGVVFLIVFLFQLDYINNLEKRIKNLQESVAGPDLKTAFANSGKKDVGTRDCIGQCQH